MRIVFVTSEYINPSSYEIVDGGLANYLHKITLELSKEGHDISVVVIYADFEQDIIYKNVKVKFIPTKYVRFKKTFFQFLIWKFLPRESRKQIKSNFTKKRIRKIISCQLQRMNLEKKIDIIQYASVSGIGKCPEKNIPSCLRISSYAKLNQKFYCYSFQQEIDDEIAQLRNSQFIFGPSRFIANYIRKDLRLNKNIEIIESPYSENEIVDEYYLNDLITKCQSRPYLLFYGSIGSLKGCGVIADCIYNVLKKYPDLFFVFIGKIRIFNNNNYLEIIKRESKEFSDRIIWYPAMPHKYLYPIISSSYGVVLPSLTENFSNACVESMRLKKIVIGTENYFSQLIDDGYSGLLCKVGDSNSLEKKIIELMELTIEKKCAIEKNAYERTQSLSPKIICQQLIEFYEYVIKNWH